MRLISYIDGEYRYTLLDGGRHGHVTPPPAPAVEHDGQLVLA